jgi:3-oxoacyl-[acyl-carrier protein] reductase
MPTESAMLTGKVVLITGGSRGAGLAIARKLAAGGASVSLIARDWHHLNAAVERIIESGGAAIGTMGDVTDPTSLDAAIVATEQAFGGLDVLVNNAGIGRYGSVAEQSPDDWRQVIEVNLLGVFNATRVALPALRRRGGGQIIAISSGAARQGYPPRGRGIRICRRTAPRRRLWRGSCERWRPR